MNQEETYTVRFETEKPYKSTTDVWHGANFQSAIETLNMKFPEGHRLVDHKRKLLVTRRNVVDKPLKGWYAR